MANEDGTDATGHEAGPSPLTQGLAAVAGAGLGAVLGGPAGAMVGAGLEPAIATLLHRTIQELSQLRSASAAHMLEAAAQRLGILPDEMVAEALAQPRQAQLLGEAIQSAAQTVNIQKIRALSRALANGLRDDGARMDEEQLVLSSLSEVDAPHIKVLAQLGPEHHRSRTASTNLRTRTAPGRGRTAAFLADACNMSQPACRAALSVLQRAGLAAPDETADLIRFDRLLMEIQGELNKLIDLALKPPKDNKIPSNGKPRRVERPGSPSRVGWYITGFGVRCLNYLQDLDDMDDDEWNVEDPSDTTLDVRLSGYPESFAPVERSLADEDSDGPTRA